MTREELFESRVDRNGPIPAHRPRLGPCWIWRGQTRGGYGRLRVSDKMVSAHVFAFERASGNPVPAGMLVCHHCDNRPCVRPSHLFLGTHQDNTLDAVAKGRWPPRGQGAGEAHTNARLTWPQVREIRRRVAAGDSQVSLAGAFGISREQVSKICRNLRWKEKT